MLKTIDRSELEHLDENTRQQMMVNGDGDYVIAQTDEKEWQRHQERVKASVAAQEKVKRSDEERKSRGLECPIDQRLFVDPVTTPCCQKTYCNECISTALIDSDLTCPGCSTENVTLEELVTDEETQQRVKAFQAEKATVVSRNDDEVASVGSLTDRKEVNADVTGARAGLSKASAPAVSRPPSKSPGPVVTHPETQPISRKRPFDETADPDSPSIKGSAANGATDKEEASGKRARSEMIHPRHNTNGKSSTPVSASATDSSKNPVANDTIVKDGSQSVDPTTGGQQSQQQTPLQQFGNGNMNGINPGLTGFSGLPMGMPGMPLMPNPMDMHSMNMGMNMNLNMMNSGMMGTPGNFMPSGLDMNGVTGMAIMNGMPGMGFNGGMNNTLFPPYPSMYGHGNNNNGNQNNYNHGMYPLQQQYQQSPGHMHPNGNYSSQASHVNQTMSGAVPSGPQNHIAAPYKSSSNNHNFTSNNTNSASSTPTLPPSSMADQFSNQQRHPGKEEDNAYVRQPVNPHRHPNRTRRIRPSDYQELGT